MDHSTLTKLDADARKKILAGVNAIYEPVRRTLGPQGANALLYRTYNRGPRITNDGVTISDVIEPENEHERLVAEAFKESAKKTNQLAGDGTTATIVIAGKLINNLFSQIFDSPIRSQSAGGRIGVMELRRQMLESKNKVIAKIKESKKAIQSLEDLEKIAIVSVEDEELGKLIASFMWKIGKDGFALVTEGSKGIIETELIEGMRFPAKVPARAFLNNPARFELIVEDAPVIVTNYALDNPFQVGAFTRNLKTTKLILFAPSFSENVLIHMVNAHKQGFQIYPIATPSFRDEQYEDLVVYTGSIFINKDIGKKLENTSDADMGALEKLVVKSSDLIEDAVAIGGGGSKERKMKIDKQEYAVSSPLQQRIETLKGQIEETKVDSHKKLLERRIASLASSMVVIRVGAPTQAESLYKKLKIEDAVYACKAALEEGYVKGGGLCLKEIADDMPDDDILKTSLLAPYMQIQENAEGYLEIKDDIIDPAKAVWLEVEHAISVVAHLSTVKILIPEKRELMPGDGYSAIADAIMVFTKFWARKEGLLKDNELEIERDRLQLYENKMSEDHD